MSKISVKILVGFVLVLISLYNVQAQIESPFVGARPVGMGGAFLTIADDGNAIYWNPAGLALMNNLHIHYSRGDFPGITSHYFSLISRVPRFSFLSPLSNHLTVGLDWLGIQSENDKLGFNDGQLHLALGVRPPDCFRFLHDLSFGFSLQLTENDTIKNSTNLFPKTANWNIGLIWQLERLLKLQGQFNIGLLLYDKYDTGLPQDIGINGPFKKHHLRAGLNYKTSSDWFLQKVFSSANFAVNMGDRINLGLELERKYSDKLNMFIRFGAQKEQNSKETTFSIGAGVIFNTGFKGLKIKSNLAKTYCPDSEQGEFFEVAAEIEGAKIVYPPIPGNFQVSEIYFNKLKLTWDDVAKENGYQICKKESSMGRWQPPIPLPKESSWYNDKKLKPGTLYNYRLWALPFESDLNFTSVGGTTIPVTWMCQINVQNSSTTNPAIDTLTFGHAQLATNGLDIQFCEENKPLLPNQFEARFKKGAYNLSFDFRLSGVDTSTWTIDIQCNEKDWPVKFSWDNSNLPDTSQANVVFKDLNTGTNIPNMKIGVPFYQLEHSAYINKTVKITYIKKNKN